VATAWFKGYVYVNFFNASQQFLGRRRSWYEVPVWYGPDVYTVTFD